MLPSFPHSVWKTVSFLCIYLSLCSCKHIHSIVLSGFVYDDWVFVNVQAYLAALLCLKDIALLRKNKYKMNFVASLRWARLLVPFFQHHVLTLCLCVHCVNSHITSNFFITIIKSVMLICDLWCHQCFRVPWTAAM